MPSRKLLTAIAAPAVLTLASVAPALGGTQAGTATAAPGSPAPSQSPRPNLVFVMADDLGWADLSSGLPNGGYANDFNETPQLDRLAAEGQSFTEAYASVQCSPTRTALHTGQYATRPTNNTYAVSGIAGLASDPLAGAPHGRAADGRSAVPVDYPTIGETLQGAATPPATPASSTWRGPRTRSSRATASTRTGAAARTPTPPTTSRRTTSSTTRSRRASTSSRRTTPRTTSTRTSRPTATA